MGAPPATAQTAIETVLGAVVVVTAVPAASRCWKVFYSIHPPSAAAHPLTHPVVLRFDDARSAMHWAFVEAARELASGGGRRA
ncbi:hypothetical protein [Coralloluteibacterium stylophorae]|uniref:Uncharacterized protein n=1 Tax=Coralloluteibacterium stylophorae TaxID=1776034 RepID=A0A8J7VU63_9GAMM|nr:hypothetical protein [Coralloluteibacterium stylophorae]MBS7456765.1 hypothetical protein [Coralloluteibacterium stylophorae]